MTTRQGTWALRPLLVVAVSLVAAACAPAAGSSPSVLPGLGGTTWTVVSIGGTDTIAASRPTIAFGTDGQVQGTASCNGYGGPYRIDGTAIAVGELASTMMLCQDDAVGVQEASFMAALRGAQTWHIDAGGDLHLAGVSEIVGRLADATASASDGVGGLVGAWDLVELGATSDFARLVPTIEFTPDGSVAGFAGCNSFGGSFVTDGSALTLGPLATTKMACERPASAVEAGYLEALSGVTGWAIEPDGHLRLDGSVPLRFVRG